jgi:hypothetical protein
MKKFIDKILKNKKFKNLKKNLELEQNVKNFYKIAKYTRHLYNKNKKLVNKKFKTIFLDDNHNKLFPINFNVKITKKYAKKLLYKYLYNKYKKLNQKLISKLEYSLVNKITEWQKYKNIYYRYTPQNVIIKNT